MEDAASAEKRSAEEFRVRVHGGPHPLRAGSEGTSGRSRDDAEQWALQPPVDPNASRRIVAHFDVDAFYSQVEELRDPRLVDRPMAVTQKYLIVTCNYPARSAGLKKLMSTQKAKALCPEVVLVSGEDLTPYRACAKKVRAALSRFGTCEKLGLDECWVDLTAEVERRIAGGGPASDPALAGHRHVCTSRVESNNKHRPQDIRAVSGDVRVSTVEADVVEDDPVQERRLRVGAVVAPEPARRWAPRARASPRPSLEARARSRTTPGRARGAPRACRAAASRARPIETNARGGPSSSSRCTRRAGPTPPATRPRSRERRRSSTPARRHHPRPRWRRRMARRP